MKSIRIKLNARGQDAYHWAAQLPDEEEKYHGCSFILDKDNPNYDWLVVIDDVSREIQKQPERLNCSDEHTLLVTTEPPTITRYGDAFTKQFAHVLTSQPESDLNHPGRIYSQTGNLWFCGHRFSEMDKLPFPEKKRIISTCCSSKQQKHTLHNDRFQFTSWLSKKIPELEMYGHGVRYIEKKHFALDPYRFHVAIENYRGPHHWTEKLSDAFLCGCLPIYYGCTNLSDYFPKESFININLYNRRDSLDIINNVINNYEEVYASRKEAIYEARKLVLNKYNLFNMISEIVHKNFNSARKKSRRPIMGRKQIRARNFKELVLHTFWKLRRHLK